MKVFNNNIFHDDGPPSLSKQTIILSFKFFNNEKARNIIDTVC